jgi:hypothetical protein
MRIAGTPFPSPGKAQIEAALRHALAALNTAPCFRVLSLARSSYEIAGELERAILRAQVW